MRIVPNYWDEELERIVPEKLKEVRSLKMQKHLRYAYQNTAFYKRKFDEAGIRPEEILDLDDFYKHVPFLTHRELIENQLVSPPFGDLLAVGLKDIQRIYSSPGPLVMPFSMGDMSDFINTTANGLYVCGARRGDIVDITSAYQWQLAGTMMDDAFRRIGCAVAPGGTGMARAHISMMKHLGVTVVFAFPSFAMKLAETARAMGVDPRKDLSVRLIILATEVYADADKQVLANAFGAQVRDMYGGAETGFVAAECPEGGGMHYFTESIMEIVDPETDRTLSDGRGGEIVTTDLSRRAMPVIRYRTGDLTDGLNLEPCACGRTSPRLKRISGRTTDIPRVKGTYFIPDRVAETIRANHDLGAFRIMIDRARSEDVITIMVESRRPPGERDKVAEKLQEEIRAVTLFRCRVQIVEPGEIRAEDQTLIDNRFPADPKTVGKTPSSPV